MSGKNKGIRKGASFSLIHKLCEYQAVRKLAETKGYPARQMCRCLGISRSAYYHWLRYPKGESEHKNKPIVDLIKGIHHLQTDMGYRQIRDDNALIMDTFDEAVFSEPDAHPLFHSDRGFQYTSKTFKKKLENQEMEQSMSRVGHCIDNGPIEGFWGIIKSEMYQMYEIIDEVSLRYAIKDYLRFYSEERPQDRYGCKTPSEVRQEALSSDVPTEYPIPENKRISKYKEKWCA